MVQFIKIDAHDLVWSLRFNEERTSPKRRRQRISPNKKQHRVCLVADWWIQFTELKESDSLLIGYVPMEGFDLEHTVGGETPGQV